VAEAFRTLATSVRFSAVGHDLHTVIVTSAERAEGKSTIAANLAVALAEMSQKVILVSADLRAPVQGEIFGLDESSKGLTSVLLGDAPLASCLQVVTLESGRTLYLLPSGPEPANPHVLLSSDQMVALLSSLTETGADFVLIDCPPVLAVGDTLALAHMVDGILVVASAGVTWRKAFAETLERLRKVGGVVDGVVLNRTEAESRYGNRYGEYGYGHRQQKVEAG
jgi:capsular exopolysaccharide synthesis family protein